MVRPDHNHSARTFRPTYEETGVATPKGCCPYETSPERAKGFHEIGSATLDWIREA
jgi:hypothetical protein